MAWFCETLREVTLVMKMPLKISLLLNLGLLAGLIFTLVAGQKRVAGLPPQPVAETRPPENAGIVPPPSPIPAAPKPFRWSQLDATDYHDYVKNLRAIGCPETALRAIVTADVHAAFSQYGRDLEQQLSNLAGGSWTNLLASANSERALKTELLNLPREEAAKTDDLLGLKPAPTESVAALAVAAQTSGAGDQPSAMNQRQARLAAQTQAAAAEAPAQVAAAAEPLAEILLPIPPNSAELPLVFQPVDPATTKLTAAQTQVVNDLRQQFAASLNGSSQNPADPAYQQTWQQALDQNNRLLEANLGQNGFIQYWDAQWDAQHPVVLANQSTSPQ